MSGVGNKNVTLGIPRLKELLDQAKSIKTPSNRIRFLSPYNKSADFASYFAATLPLTRLNDIVTRCDLIHDPDPKVTNIQTDTFMVNLDNQLEEITEVNFSQYVVRLTLNQGIMQTRRITPPMVRTLLRNRLFNKAHVISSETNNVEWIMRIRFKRMQDMMKSIPSSQRNEYEGLLCHRVVSAMLNTVAISGHIRLSGAQAGTEEQNGNMQHIVDTQGTSLIDLSAAACVDWYHTTSNDVNEVHAALGIEATVNTLFSELVTTISFDGTYVDPRHIMMIVNTMTRGGYVMPLSRHGLNRMDTGPLLRCSFEETPDILCDAACFGECDNGQGVSQNIMTGKLAEIGSGAMHIRVAPDMLHPRDNLNLANKTNVRKRVLKSTVRRRDMPLEIELHERERSALRMGDDISIEAPFTITSISPNNPNASERIFSTESCQVPYNDDMSTQPLETYEHERPNKRQREYRPMSPQSDSDMDTLM